MKTIIQNLFSRLGGTSCALALLALFALHSPPSTAQAQGTAFTYQGQLQNNASPANGFFDFDFSLFNASSSGSQIGSTLSSLDVGVTNGLFTVTLDFGANFPGAARWLAISVRTNGGAGFTALNPLQELTPTPYAIYAPNAGNATTAGTAGSVAAANITGTVPLAQLPAAVLTNNNATSVNVNGTLTASNFQSDSSGDFVAGQYNTVSGGDSTVSGGEDNTASGNQATVAGGYANTASAAEAVVGGGYVNTASGDQATVAGGNRNIASGVYATVGGGVYNTASGVYATVGGGRFNQATNSYATVPGGATNIAGGQYSFAAGQQAQATNQGAFVWADSQNSVFASTNNDSFNVRAQGGVRLVTSGAGMTIDGQPVLTNNQSSPTFAGTVTATSFVRRCK